MLQIRERKLATPLFLAPMAGLTHSALRTVLLSFGGIGLLSTEMLSARRLPVENQTVSPYLVKTDGERPLSYQLLLTEVNEVAPAVSALHRFSADAVDINLGCPAPRVKRWGGGSSLAMNPYRLREIVRTLRKETELPVSAKIRLGNNTDSHSMRDFCLMLQDEGVDFLTVHARLPGESFSRKPRWEMVAQVKSWLRIPVIVNGGIFSVEDGARCLRLSQADGLMIGRAAARKPWIFAQLARELYGADIPEVEVCLPQIYGQFVLGLLRFGPERRLGRLKEFSHYFAHNYAFGHHLATSIQKSATITQAWQRAIEFFGGADPDQLLKVDTAKISAALSS